MCNCTSCASPSFQSESPSFWIVIYPRGDRTKISVAEIFRSSSYEKDEYDLASRRELASEIEAAAYGRSLAKIHGLAFAGKSHTDGILD